MFYPRDNAPAYNNKYYVKTTYGGLNKCMAINKNTGSVLANCTGYAWGRFLEECGIETCSLPATDAGTWFNSNHGYEKGSLPKKGAVICYGGGWENRGHVGIVEEVYENGSVVVSQSNYGGTLWEKVNLAPPYFSQGASLYLQGFIYNPHVEDSPTPTKIKMYGIDVSEHNDITLDISKYDFVLIRACWGTNEDYKANEWRKKCEELGIPYGVYLYSYSLSINDGVDEANYICDMVKDWKIQMGVWIDMENDSYKQSHGSWNPELCSNVCRVFCETVQARGYYTGIYASESVFGTMINGCDNFDKWVASWGTNDGTIQRDTSDMGTILQYTSRGGIGGSPLDANVAYCDLDHYKSYPIEEITPPEPVTPEPVTPVEPSKDDDDMKDIIDNATKDGYLFEMSDKVYDWLKVITAFILPLLIREYPRFAQIWGWGYSEQVVNTLAELITIINAILYVSSVGYHKMKGR